MNPRVLELLKNPQNIQSEDLDLLKDKIDSFPYIQNIRALYLYGVHLFDKENYQKELSTTAAYTTNKKILYQLINGKIQQTPKLKIVEKTTPETIDLKSSLGSGILVTQIQEKPATEETQFSNEEQNIRPIIDKEVEKVVKSAPETLIEEENIQSKAEKEIIDNVLELNFLGTESFLPDVKIQSTSAEEVKMGAPQSNINKHEEEMRRLIEEVERKIRENKSVVAQTQSFEVKSKEISKTPETIENSHIEIKESIIENEPEVKTTWKPMSFETHIPDSLHSKAVEIKHNKIQDDKSLKTEEKEDSNAIEDLPKTKKEDLEISNLDNETLTEEKIENDSLNEEAAIMNVSFFGTDISRLKINKPIKVEKEIEEDTQKDVAEVQKSTSIDSNVLGFINTWQSWLKIDRSKEIKKEKSKIKNKAIETFIENNPKISQLKNEITFVVKEKTDDISHLMTETLANLYVEQKLYTKAIKAFEVLIGKYPEKKKYFESKIQKIKDIRNRN